MLALVPEKPSRMDNGVQLFSTCSVIALGLHCCRPSRSVTKTVSSWAFQGCSPYNPHVYMPGHSNRREKALRAVGVYVCLWKTVHGREESCQHPGFANSPHNPAGQGRCSPCYIAAWTSRTSFPCNPLLQSLHTLHLPPGERQGSSRQQHPPLLYTLPSCVLNKQRISHRKNHRVTPWLRRRLAHFCRAVCGWGPSSKWTRARAPQPHSPKEGWEHTPALYPCTFVPAVNSVQCSRRPKWQ